MWSDRHHSYLKRDSRGSGSSLPPLPQVLAWDRLRLCGLGKTQFKAQNHVGKMLPCWGILLLPFVVIVKAGHHVSALPSPCPWRPPLECGQVQQARPLGCARYVCVGSTCPAGSSEFLPTMWPKPATSVPLSFQTRNRWLLPLMSTVASATTDLPEPSLSPPDSQVFIAPCVQEENLQGKFGFFDITVLSPPCVPPSSPAPSWPPSAPPFHLQSYIRKALSESGKSQKRPLMSQCPALPCPPCPALPCHQLLERLPLPGLQGLFWLMRSPVMW